MFIIACIVGYNEDKYCKCNNGIKYTAPVSDNKESGQMVKNIDKYGTNWGILLA